MKHAPASGTKPLTGLDRVSVTAYQRWLEGWVRLAGLPAAPVFELVGAAVRRASELGERREPRELRSREGRSRPLRGGGEGERGRRQGQGGDSGGVETHGGTRSSARGYEGRAIRARSVPGYTRSSRWSLLQASSGVGEESGRGTATKGRGSRQWTQVIIKQHTRCDRAKLKEEERSGRGTSEARDPRNRTVRSRRGGIAEC